LSSPASTPVASSGWAERLVVDGLAEDLTAAAISGVFGRVLGAVPEPDAPDRGTAAPAAAAAGTRLELN